MKNKYEIALEVIRGDWGYAPERWEKLEAAGYDSQEIQNIVDNVPVQKIIEFSKAHQNDEASCDPADTLEVKVNLKKVKQVMLIFEE